MSASQIENFTQHSTTLSKKVTGRLTATVGGWKGNRLGLFQCTESHFKQLAQAFRVGVGVGFPNFKNHSTRKPWLAPRYNLPNHDDPIRQRWTWDFKAKFAGLDPPMQSRRTNQDNISSHFDRFRPTQPLKLSSFSFYFVSWFIALFQFFSDDKN